MVRGLCPFPIVKMGNRTTCSRAKHDNNNNLLKKQSEKVKKAEDNYELELAKLRQLQADKIRKELLKPTPTKLTKTKSFSGT